MVVYVNHILYMIFFHYYFHECISKYAFYIYWDAPYNPFNWGIWPWSVWKKTWSLWRPYLALWKSNLETAGVLPWSQASRENQTMRMYGRFDLNTACFELAISWPMNIWRFMLGISKVRRYLDQAQQETTRQARGMTGYFTSGCRVRWYFPQDLPMEFEWLERPSQELYGHRQEYQKKEQRRGDVWK